jgi:ubiquinone/menaquinone biosynthesis C-methylase UbiE
MIAHPSHDVNRRWWNEVTPVHIRSEFYGVERFLAGENALDAIERQALADPRGKSLLHLQCHFGLATLSWARLGARAVGVDFSEEGIRGGQDLAARAGLQEQARFTCCDVLELDRHLEEQFDCVFTSYGVLTWLSDLDRWAKIVARFLKPGGRFYIAEIHPASMVFDNSTRDFKLRFDYFHAPDPVVLNDSSPDYADPSYVSTNETHEWAWSLADVFHALWGAGLEITEFEEYPYSCYRQFPQMEQRADGFWHLPDDIPRLPQLFSLAATHKSL